MYLLYCDETNLEARSGDFFVYGGIAIPPNKALILSDQINEIRKNFKISPDFPIKFNPGPSHLSNKGFIDLKKSIIQASVDAGCILFVSLILHDIAESPNIARINEINRVLFGFNKHLEINNEVGLVLIDRFSDNQIDAHLVEKISQGIIGLPFSPTRRLNKIVGAHYSAIGQSNFTSIIDISLGSLRFCINSFTRQETTNINRSAEILPLLSPLFHRYKGQTKISNQGLFFSPVKIKYDGYGRQYSALKDFLRKNGCPLD